MTSYFSILFLCGFLPLVIVLYCAMPKRWRWSVLLGASYLFFWCVSGKLLVFALISTVSIYVAGRIMARQIAARDNALKEASGGRAEIRRRFGRRMGMVLVATIALNVGMLAAMKYLVFFGGLAASLLQLFGFGATFALPVWAAPIGISFYTLMAVSYLVDVYRGTIPAERHFGRVALYLAFFPHIMEGPLARYGETGSQLSAGNSLTWNNFNAGVMRILWGLAKKVIVADRLDAFVKPVFDNYAAYDGGVIALAAIVYTVQLYCDFSGTIDIALGIGRIFGVKLPENFRQPFFSRTASEFWQRWHITLGTWFRDYVYYPVSLSKPMKSLTKTARRRLGNRIGPLAASSVALFCVWVANGLWHGAGSQYLFFGMYYFVIILAGGFLEPVMQRFSVQRGINRQCVGYRVFQITRTLVVVFVGELFFRANGLNAGLAMFAQMVGSFSLDSFTNGALLHLGLDIHDYLIIGVVLVVVLGVGIAKERGGDPIAFVRSRTALRWAVPLGLLTAVVVFGAYGAGYAPVAPLYAQF